MKTNSKILLSLLLTFAMVFSLITIMPLTASAAPATINISLLNTTNTTNASGVDAWSYNATYHRLSLTQAGGSYTLTGVNENLQVQVSSTAVNASVTLNNADISGSQSNVPAFQINANCNIYLSGDSYVTGFQGGGAFRIDSNVNCTINGSGRLVAKSTGNGTTPIGFMILSGAVLEILGSGDIWASSERGVGVLVSADASLRLAGSGDLIVQGGDGFAAITSGTGSTIQMGDNTALYLTNNSVSAETHRLERSTPSSALHWRVTNADTTNGGGSGATVDISIAPGRAAIVDRVAPTPVTLDSATANGASGTITSTYITLAFSDAVYDLTADNITITNGTGTAVKGTLTGGPINWDIAISGVSQGTVNVTVTDPPGYAISGRNKTVNVYKFTTYGIDVKAFTETIPKGGTFTFPSAEVGSDYNLWQPFDIRSTGTDTITNLNATLSNGAAFTLNKDDLLSTLSGDLVTGFYIAVKTDLAAGTYTDTITISGTNLDSYIFTISFTVSGPGSGKPGDVNGDNKVDATDLSMLIADFGKTSGYNPGSDINGDKKVDATDLSILISNFGK